MKKVGLYIAGFLPLTVTSLSSAMDKTPAIGTGGTWIEPPAAHFTIVLFYVTDGAAGRKLYTSAICDTKGELRSVCGPVLVP